MERVSTYDLLQDLYAAAKEIADPPAKLLTAITELENMQLNMTQQDQDCIRLARMDYVEPGEVEIDEIPLISPADGGAWVGAWVWVGLEGEGDGEGEVEKDEPDQETDEPSQAGRKVWVVELLHEDGTEKAYTVDAWSLEDAVRAARESAAKETGKAADALWVVMESYQEDGE